MRRRWLIPLAACVLAAGLIAVIGLGSASADGAVAAASSAGVAGRQAPDRLPLPAAGPGERAEARRDSLQGTSVDGAITLDAAGKPVPDRAMRRLFDYFLTRLGERDLAAIRDDVRRHLQPRLGPAALAQVLAWFDRYVVLERESAALGVGGDLRADLQRRHALRRRHLGDAVALAWYGEDERALAVAIARREVLRDPALSPQQRAERLAQLDRASGAASDATRTESQLVELVREQSALFDAQATSPAQRMAEREALFGVAAARRLATLDARRAQWDGRVSAYRDQRRRLLADTSLSAAERQRRVDGLLAGFTGNERRRVEALARHDPATTR
ncbi:lipase secretion chaperone [Montanilutibacter psychrotolerans]|uniref:Lipase chaperone n=1 Tax=Montanilutibacter psychrotolerans TaxID=1327343 RepID=A0A3M8T2R4_9GAMM|nr:lipase secretion chaperone [Lysobacter psychrotolerans]RNF86026.1 hypothetical protein EER27_00905 [Lysobacter psychrotolerans]